MVKERYKVIEESVVLKVYVYNSKKCNNEPCLIVTFAETSLPVVSLVKLLTVSASPANFHSQVSTRPPQGLEIQQ